MLESFLNGAFGDLVEDHAAHVLALELASLFQLILDVPADGFPFTIRVGREDQLVVVLQRFFYIFQTLIAVRLDQPRHFKIVIRIDGAVLGGQVSDVSETGKDLEVLAQILVDGLSLGGRLNDNNSHVFFRPFCTNVRLLR